LAESSRSGQSQATTSSPHASPSSPTTFLQKSRAASPTKSAKWAQWSIASPTNLPRRWNGA